MGARISVHHIQPTPDKVRAGVEDVEVDVVDVVDVTESTHATQVWILNRMSGAVGGVELLKCVGMSGTVVEPGVVVGETYHKAGVGVQV